MAWYYEILHKSKTVLEQSKPVYASHWEAQWAGYRRFKDREVEIGLRSPMIGNIRARRKDQLAA